MSDRSTRIRLAFVALLVLGTAFRLWRGYLLQEMLGDDSANFDYESLSYLSIASTALNLSAWAVIVVGVRALHRQSISPGPLRVSFWCWSFALVVDVLLLAVSMSGLGGEPLYEVMNWVTRISTLAIAGGAVAAVVHARAEGASSEATALAAIGIIAYVGILIGFEFASSVSFDWVWTPYMLGALAIGGLSGGMALLPWTTLGGDEGGDYAPGSATRPGVAAQASPGSDLLVGALWLGGGLLVTVVSMQGDGIGGRAVLAWGPMLYGAYRIVRGLAR